MPVTVATALASADRPDPELAADVVREALARTGAEIAHSVLLFLSGEFARHAQSAVTAASRAAHCLQVVGCSAPGVFTERDWVLDRPAVAAMVMASDVSLDVALDTGEPVLSLATPATASSRWLGLHPTRFGMLSTDGNTQQHGKIWGHAKVVDEARFDAAFHGTRGCIGISRGMRILGEIMEVTHSEGYEVLRINRHAALNTLLRELPLELREQPRLPLHLLFLGVIGGDAAAQALHEGRYTLVPLIGTGAEDGAVTLAAQLGPGSRVFWCMRSPLAAERDTRVMLDDLDSRLGGAPDFGVMFSCMGRGPYFYDGVDRDLQLVRTHHPRLPLIGTYGGGEIAPSAYGAAPVHNSVVLALFRRNA